MKEQHGNAILRARQPQAQTRVRHTSTEQRGRGGRPERRLCSAAGQRRGPTITHRLVHTCTLPFNLLHWREKAQVGVCRTKYWHNQCNSVWDRPPVKCTEQHRPARLLRLSHIRPTAKGWMKLRVFWVLTDDRGCVLLEPSVGETT